MSQFDRPMIGFRFVTTDVGDTLQEIAARELGDASRWTEIVAYNNLVPPFITDDADEAGPGVILTGSRIRLPAPSTQVSARLSADQAFGTDMRLDRGALAVTDAGDFDVVSGSANLVQALSNRVVTERGELVFHPRYGCETRRLVGLANGPTKRLLAAQSAKAAVRQDPRVTRVTKAIGSVNGDVIAVGVVAETVLGSGVQVVAKP
jgi:phage baseplate assembly protein W